MIEGVAPTRPLKRRYDLTDEEALVLAYMLHFNPNAISRTKLETVIENCSEEPDYVLGDLQKRGFISERGFGTEGGTCFRVTPEALDAFKEGVEFGAKLFDDYMSALRDHSLDNILDDRWLVRFNASIATERDGGVFLRASQALGLCKLSNETQSVFWLMVKHFRENFDAPYSYDNTDWRGSRIENGIQELVKEGLVSVTNETSGTNAKSEYSLSLEAVRLLFSGCDELISYKTLAKFANVVKCESIEAKDLFFSREASDEIESLTKLLSPDGFKRAKSILAKQKRAQSILSLLWGPPGTGKTEVVRQIARQSGRDIIQFDTSKVISNQWGASERFYRALFRSYNCVAVVSSNPPILLLNEADDVLSKRLTNLSHSIDKGENILTSILLQEFESLNGILLATTNLIDNLDDAFDRRFLFKTKMVLPDASARANIWKSNIPELTDDEANYLAGTYVMSGAQISNVVLKRNLAELYYEGDRGIDYITPLCEQELSRGSGTESRRAPIGYQL